MILPMATRREVFQQIYDVALGCYGDENEARSIAELIVMSRGGITRSDLIVEPRAELCIADLATLLDELRAWRPVQYILGCASFDDMELEVNESVLIPRPETEELVAWAASVAPRDARILDIGTGSGCIAIALARRLTDSRVWGMDVSSAALTVARRNGAKYAPSVQFVEGDALVDFPTLFDHKFDMVISNPPYIPVADKAAMRPNVTQYEPSTALYVPDDDPLLFYRAIARTARTLLTDGGVLFFEIYEMLGDAMQRMLADEGYRCVELRRDFKDKPRMICARRV